MNDNQTQYSEVEELKKEIDKLLQDEHIDNNARKSLTQCATVLNSSYQNNLDKTIAGVKYNLGVVYQEQGKIEQAKQCYQDIQEKHDLQIYA